MSLAIYPAVKAHFFQSRLTFIDELALVEQQL